MSNARDKANIPALNFSSTGIDDNATSTAITIDSSENVGISTTSPVSKLTVGDSLYSYELTRIGSGGLSNQDIIVLICEKEVETIHLVGRFYTPKTGTGNGYSRNSFLVNVNFFADDVVGTTPQIVFDGQYRGIHANSSDNLKVVEATVDGTTYWGFIIQNLGTYQGPGPIYFDGGITSISNFNFCYRGDASSVTIVTPSNSASSSKIIATQNFKLRNEIHGNVLTTSNNGDISFYEDTGTTPKFFWDASAERLGIGTSSPSQLLEVSATSGLASGSGTTNAIRIADVGAGSSWSTTQDFSQLQFSSTDTSNPGGSGVRYSIGVVSHDTANTYSDLTFRNYDGTEHMRINGAFGNVGIGTSSPTQKLDVSGQINVSNGITFSGALSSGTGIASSGANGNLRLYSGGVQVITVTSSKVGIGEQSPSSKLHIKNGGQTIENTSGISNESINFVYAGAGGSSGNTVTLATLGTPINGSHAYARIDWGSIYSHTSDNGGAKSEILWLKYKSDGTYVTKEATLGSVGDFISADFYWDDNVLKVDIPVYTDINAKITIVQHSFSSITLNV